MTQMMVKGDRMRKIVLLERKTMERADKTVLEANKVVRECVTALCSGKVRPSASGLVRDDATAEQYTELAERVQDLSEEAARLRRYVRRVLELAAPEDETRLARNASGLVRDASGLVRDASGLVRDVFNLVKGTTIQENCGELIEKADNWQKHEGAHLLLLRCIDYNRDGFVQQDGIIVEQYA